jgi:hypothetical protein
MTSPVPLILPNFQFPIRYSLTPLMPSYATVIFNASYNRRHLGFSSPVSYPGFEPDLDPKAE